MKYALTFSLFFSFFTFFCGQDDGIMKTSPIFLKVEEGQAVSFRCQAKNMTNVKNTDVRWRFQSQDGSIEYDLPNSRWIQTNAATNKEISSIDLKRAQVSDSGRYICKEPTGKSALSELIVIPEPMLVTITPKEVHVIPGQKVVIDCHAKDVHGKPSGSPQFHFSNRNPIRGDSRFVVSHVGPGHSRLSVPSGLSSGDNNIIVYCTSKGQKVNATISVSNTCPPGYGYCQNGHCLESFRFNNNIVDCADGSDEKSKSNGRSWTSKGWIIQLHLWLPIGLFLINRRIDH